MPITSNAYALERKEKDNQENNYTIKEANSTELSLSLWLKVVTLQLETELEVKAFMATNLKTKTLKLNTPKKECYPWQMLDQTLTDHNSS